MCGMCSPRPVMSRPLLEARALVCELLCETINDKPTGPISRDFLAQYVPPPSPPPTPSQASAISEKKEGGGPIVVDAAAWAREGGYGLSEVLTPLAPQEAADPEVSAIEAKEEAKGEGEVEAKEGEMDMEALKEMCDLRLPHEWYPYAR